MISKLLFKLRNAKKIVKNQFLTSGDHEDTERISQNPETQENSFKSLVFLANNSR